jgi:dihydroneopterin aldolase
VIGDLPEERDREQHLRVDVVLSLGLSVVGASDKLDDTVDYGALAEAIRAALKEARCHMIEAAAERVAKVCLSDRRIVCVRVRVEKPGAIAGLRAAAVTVTRRRSEVTS